MKKINVISSLKKIAILSCLSILGIFAWCVNSLDMGGRGMTGTLLLAVFVLLLVACNATIVASEATLWNEYNQTKKQYLLARRNAKVKKNALFEHGLNKKKKWFMVTAILVLTVCFFFATHICAAKSLLMTAFLTFVVFYILLAIVLAIWNKIDINRLRKMRREM